MPEGPFYAARGGVLLRVRLSPGKKSDCLLAIAPSGAGGRALKVSVKAPPEGGRANEALLALLARAFSLPRNGLSLLSGGRSRNKSVLIAGDPGALLPRLSAFLAALPQE